MKKVNCWEFKECGREPGAAAGFAAGACPAATDGSFDGINGGTNGGRICWVVAGTYCEDKVQGTFAKKRSDCVWCEFFQQVKAEEGEAAFQFLLPGQASKQGSP